MAKEITLKIKMDGAGKIESDIQEISEGLSDLDKHAAREAKEALDRIDRTSFANIRSQVKQLGESLETAGKKITNFGNGLKDAGQKMTIGLTLPILGFGAAAIKTFADVELAVANISSIKPEIDTKQVMSALNEMSTRIPQTAQELGDGLYNIFSSINVTQEEGLQLLEKFGKGATAAQTDAKTFGTAVLGVMNAYKLSVADADHISDVFFNTVNAGVVNGQELASSLGTVTQAAKNAGVGLDELGALIVGVTKEGGEASQNINNLANFLMKLPTKDATDALKGLGVEVQQAGKFRPILDVLSDLKVKLDAMTESERALALQSIFPDAQARTGVQTLLSQLDAVKEALTVNKTAAGAANSAYQKIAATASVQFQLLKNTSIAILAELGSAILPVLQPLIIWLSQNLIPAVKQAVAEFKTWSPAMQTVVVAVAAFVASIGPALVVLGTLIAAIGTAVSAIGAVAGVIGSIGLGPLIAIIAGVAAELALVGAAAYSLYEIWKSNFGNIKGIVIVFSEQVREAFNSLLATIQPALDEISNYASESFSKLKEWWAENGAEINQAATTVLAGLLSAIQSILDSIRSFWQEHGDTIIAVVSSTWNTVKGIISGFAGVVGGIIKMIAQVINGNWDGAWKTFNEIVQSAMNAVTAFLVGSGAMLFSAIKAALVTAFSISVWVYEKSFEIGGDIARGLANGITNGRGLVRTAISSLTFGAADMAMDTLQIKSPSRVFIKFGEYVGEGLALGIEKKVRRAKQAAKKLADETIKELNEAVKAFNKIANLTPDQVARKSKADDYQQAANDLDEIIKLRNQTGINVREPLPKTLAGVSAELGYLKGKIDQAKEAQDKFEDSMKKLEDTAEKAREARRKDAEDWAKYKESIRQNGEEEALSLQKEIDLTGIIDPMERQRIENAYNIKQLRLEMKSDGYGEQQINEAAEILRLEQARNLELHRILEIRKQVAEAKDLAKSMGEDLEELQRGGRELTEYEKTLRKIETDLKDLDPSQKQYLLNLAASIDKQREFNKVYEQTYNFIRDTLDILTDKNLSFGDKIKSIFGGIADTLQENFLDKLAGGLTDAIFGVDFSKSKNPVVGEIQTSNDYLEKIYGVISGNPVGGLSSVGSFGGSGGGLSGFTGLIHQILHGGSSSGGVNGRYGGGMDENGVFSYAGGLGIGGGASASPGASASVWQNLKNLFSTKDGGMFAPVTPMFGNGGKPSALGGILSGAGGIAQMIGGMIGGRWGGAISMAGQGMQLGAMVGGPWGAAIGGAAGFLIGLFSNSQRKADEKARTQYKVETLQSLDQLIKQLNARPPQIQSAAAAQQLDQIIQQYTQAASALKDKKTRRIALNELSPNEAIGYRKSQVEQALSGAKLYEARAAAAQDLYSRILPEFASGVFMDSGFRNQFSDFKRRNGMMSGSYTGRDYIGALIGDGEMVLNASQIGRVRANAGYDVFANAGIPNYTPQSSGVPRFAEGVSFASTSSAAASPQINLAPQFNITFENVTPMPGAKMILDTPEGKKEIYDIVEDGFANGKIKLKKR